MTLDWRMWYSGAPYFLLYAGLDRPVASWKTFSESTTFRFMAVEAMTASVDFPAPRIPVSTIEASSSNRAGEVGEAGRFERMGEAAAEEGVERSKNVSKGVPVESRREGLVTKSDARSYLCLMIETQNLAAAAWGCRQRTTAVQGSGVFQYYLHPSHSQSWPRMTASRRQLPRPSQAGHGNQRFLVLGVIRNSHQSTSCSVHPAGELLARNC